MITLRRSEDRGHFDMGWLDTRHSFSFGQYLDPQHMGFRSVRVINEDWIKAGNGFGKHPHDNMEIVTYVVAGELKHEDSLGNGSIIRPGEVQRMTAGPGITHSEFNPSETDPVHLLQIWILPERTGLEPGYEQKTIPEDGNLTLVAGPEGGDHGVQIHQDARIYRGRLATAESAAHPLESGRHVWVQLIEGQLRVNGDVLDAGDGAAASDESGLTLEATSNTHFLLFDLA